MKKTNLSNSEFMNRPVVAGYHKGVSGPEALISFAVDQYNFKNSCHVSWLPISFDDGSNDVALSITHAYDVHLNEDATATACATSEQLLQERAEVAADIYNTGILAKELGQLLNKQSEIRSLIHAIIEVYLRGEGYDIKLLNQLQGEEAKVSDLIGKIMNELQGKVPSPDPSLPRDELYPKVYERLAEWGHAIS